MDGVVSAEQGRTEHVKCKRVFVDLKLAKGPVLSGGDVSHVVNTVKLNPKFVEEEVK